MTWFLGSTSPNKIIHAAGCRYARHPYPWADRQGDARAVARALHESGSVMWHRACRVCNQPLVDAILDGFGRYVPVMSNNGNVRG